jgi:poly-gamma-glutamate capsule biosynthesis protein CapA/YwtB (metallophosphatase superfamily)
MLWGNYASGQADTDDTLHTLSLLALGDINLGRSVGQEILKGNIDYPFAKCKNMFMRADVLFANLESPVTDQHGETQSPKSNVVFCAPPPASSSLRRSGMFVVSTANNHAFDYGVKGIQETSSSPEPSRIPAKDTSRYF